MKQAIILGGAALVASLLFLPGMEGARAAASADISAGVFTEEQAARGEELYSAKCAECHGESLVGGDVVPTLIGNAFLGKWQGQSVGDLTRRMRTTMPLGAPGTLGLADTADVTAFILQSNGFPAGGEPLPGSSSAQSGISMVAQPPGA